MKKVILVFAICLGISVSLSSCKDKNHKHSEDTHMHDDAEVTETVSNEKELAVNSVYQCPMNCEKGKSYIKEGSCPVCKMNLKPKEVDMDSDTEHMEGHDKDEEGHHHDNKEGAHHDTESNPSEGGRITKDAKVESTPNN